MNDLPESFLALRRLSLRWVPLLAAPALIALAIAGGGELLRLLLLLVAVCLLALPLLASLEAGLMALMLFESLRGFLRRAQYLIVTYTQTDPIHVVTPAVTVLAFALLLSFHRHRIFTETALAVPCSLLTLIYCLQIFNPLQGGLTVGLSGVIYLLIPMCWFYFGQAVKPEFMGTALRLVIVLALVCSLHGLYQLTFGFPSFEQYWIDQTEFYPSIAIGNFQRALATFSSAEEWGRYVEFGALAAFGFGLGAARWIARGGYFAAGIALMGVLLLTGQRTSIFGLLLGLGVLLLLGAATLKAAALRVALMLACAGLVPFLAKPPEKDEVWRKDQSKVGAMLSHTARGTLNPAKEDSLHERLLTWTILLTEELPARPLGSGLGAGTLADVRFNNLKEDRPIDSFLMVLAKACGVPAALLFLWILARTTVLGVRGYRRAEPGTPAATVARIAAAFVPVLILNNLIGLTFSIYSCAPVGWLLIGWISAEATRAGEAEAWLRGRG